VQTIEVEDSRLIAYEQWVTLAADRSFQLLGYPRQQAEPTSRRDPLRSLHLHVITIDRPGYGGSTALPGRRVIGRAQRAKHPIVRRHIRCQMRERSRT
jgi:hypothetical protein